MREIKMLVENIEEELEDAEKYAKAALYHKHTDSEMSRMFADLARQELAHSEILHGHAVRLIRMQREKGTEVPAAMQAVWDWEHERMVEHTTKIKGLIAGVAS